MSTARRWSLAGAGALILALSVAAGAQAQGAFYREVEKDGRIYVFNNMQQFEAWEQSGEMGKSLTRINAGPSGETLVFDSEEAVNLYNFRHNLPGEVFKQEPAASPKAPSIPGLEDLSVGALWYLSYQHMDDANKVTIKRGYVDIKKKVLKWGPSYLEARITPDVHQDETGDLKMRLKYAYGKFNFKSVGWEPWLELGIVHMPWLDFEEHVNLFRMQDTMFIERNKTFNSADFGATLGGFLGGKLEGLKYYPGRYGSFAVGVYNGGGYHAAEKNKNKVIEGRLTLRPLPDQLRGLQLSYFGVSGKGNTEPSPDYNVNMGMLSYEGAHGVVTGTYYAGRGNQKGDAVDDAGDALSRTGYSFFGELRVPPVKGLSLIARYDYFDPNEDVPDDDNKRIIAGVAYDMGHHNTFLLDFDKVQYSDGRSDDNRVQLTLQIKY